MISEDNINLISDADTDNPREEEASVIVNDNNNYELPLD